jgi:hypothetical protein
VAEDLGTTIQVQDKNFGDSTPKNSGIAHQPVPAIECGPQMQTVNFDNNHDFDNDGM